MAWLEQTRACNDWGARQPAGDLAMLAYIVKRRNQIELLTKGAPYGQVNQHVDAATHSFEQQLRAHSQRPGK